MNIKYVIALTAAVALACAPFVSYAGGKHKKRQNNQQEMVQHGKKAGARHSAKAAQHGKRTGSGQRNNGNGQNGKNKVNFI